MCSKQCSMKNSPAQNIYYVLSVVTGDVDLLKEECRKLREECQTLKEDNRHLSERLQLLQRQRTW